MAHSVRKHLRIEIAQMAIRSLDTGQQNTLTQGSYPRVTATDELIFSRSLSLWAVRLDQRSLSLLGEPVPVLGDVRTFLNGLAQYDVTDDGILGADGRLLMIREASGGSVPAQIVVVESWFSELERLLPLH